MTRRRTSSDVHIPIGGSISKLAAVSFVVLISVLTSGCGGSAELTSSWNPKEVTIDGRASEWGTHLSALKDTHVSLGVQNDQDYLYLCLTSTDLQFRRQMMGLGLTVWFESENGEKLGIQYPIGMREQGRLASFEPEENRQPEDRRKLMEEALQNLEVLGPGKDDRNLLSILQAPGISVKVGSSEGPVVYELKLPLKKSNDHPYAIGAGVGSTVKLAIETGKFEPQVRQGDGGPSGGMRGGRRGGGGGGMPGGGGYGGGRQGRESGGGSRPDPLDVSLKVHLTGPSSGNGK
jgi:hypothetical protein